ncbi:MAG: hypothetical protein PHH82_03445 [Candidatus ainarchaeum sp.]|nr:hypothetical protein [Candidatus ainarchaeum sp.]
MKKFLLTLILLTLLTSIAFSDYPLGYTETSISGLQIWGHDTLKSDAAGISWNEALTVQFTVKNNADYAVTIPDIYMSIEGFDPKKTDTSPGFLNAKSEKTIYETYTLKNGIGTGINSFIVELFNNTSSPSKLSKSVYVEMPIQITNTLNNSSVDYTSKKINLKLVLTNYSEISYPGTIKINYWPGGELNTLTKNFSINASEDYIFSETLNVKDLINKSLLNSNGKNVEFCAEVGFTTTLVNNLESDCTDLDIDMLIPKINEINITPSVANKDTKFTCDVKYDAGAIEESTGIYKWYKNLVPIENGSEKYFNCAEQGCNPDDKIMCSFELSVPLSSGTEILTKDSTEVIIGGSSQTTDDLDDSTDNTNTQDQEQIDSTTTGAEPNLISTQDNNDSDKIVEQKSAQDNNTNDTTESEEAEKGFWARLWAWILSWFS